MYIRDNIICTQTYLALTIRQGVQFSAERSKLIDDQILNGTVVNTNIFIRKLTVDEDFDYRKRDKFDEVKANCSAVYSRCKTWKVIMSRMFKKYIRK